MRLRLTLVSSLVGLLGCASSSQNTVAASRWPPRLQPLENIIANAEQFPCAAGLHSIPATVVEVGVFANVPYQSFSNGTVEVNAYGDPGDLVGLEAGTQTQDPALQQCLIQFVAAQTLSASDRQRVERGGVRGLAACESFEELQASRIRPLAGVLLASKRPGGQG
jgi:hypothetical protein